MLLPSQSQNPDTPNSHLIANVQTQSTTRRFILSKAFIRCPVLILHLYTAIGAGLSSNRLALPRRIMVGRLTSTQHSNCRKVTTAWPERLLGDFSVGFSSNCLVYLDDTIVGPSPSLDCFHGTTAYVGVLFENA